MEEEQKQQSGWYAADDDHEHQYQIAVGATIVVRWCTECGHTHFIQWYARDGMWESRWTEVREEE